jgi:hypothetical protein
VYDEQYTESEDVMNLPVTIANFIKDVLAMRSSQILSDQLPDDENCYADKCNSEKLVDKELKHLQQVVKIKLSDDLKEIIDAYFEEAECELRRG